MPCLSLILIPTDPESLQKAHQRGQEEARHVLAFLRENLAGFEEASLLPFPPELYVRESRHIVGEYQLQVADLLHNRTPFDTVALASYPLDYQASTPEYDGFVLFNPAIYGIPLRSLIPKGLLKSICGRQECRLQFAGCCQCPGFTHRYLRR